MPQPGQPLEHLSHTCGRFTAGLYDQPPGYRDANFQRLHQAEPRADLGDLSGYVIQGWE